MLYIDGMLTKYEKAMCVCVYVSGHECVCVWVTQQQLLVIYLETSDALSQL